MNKTINTRNLFFVMPLLAIVVISCGKDHEPGNPVDNTLPSWQIAQSEQLQIPHNIAVSGSTRLATYFARGVQQYKAQVKAGSNPVTYEWVFVAPQADLFDSDNKKRNPWRRSLLGIIPQRFCIRPAFFASQNSFRTGWLQYRLAAPATQGRKNSHRHFCPGTIYPAHSHHGWQSTGTVTAECP